MEKISRRSVVKKIYRWGYWIGVFAFSLGFAEFTLRVWDFRPTYVLNAKGVESPLPFYLDTGILYRLLPCPSIHINRLGYRDFEFTEKSSKERIVVIGDSFPMGLVVRPEDTFPKVLENLLSNSEVLNLGVQGYGPDQELISLQDDGLRLNPKRVIWSLFPSNDFNDLLKNRLFYVSPENGDLLPRHPNAIEKVYPFIRAPMFVRFLMTGRFFPQSVEESLQPLLFLDGTATAPIDESVEQLMSAIIQRGSQILSQRKILLTAVVIPSYEVGAEISDSRLEEVVAKICTKLKVDLVDLTTAFSGHLEFYSKDDHHLSAEGHVKVATEIASHLRESQL